MVSIQSLNNTLDTMADKHRSGEGASYEDIRDDIEAFKNQLDAIKKIVTETKTKLLEYAKVSGELKTKLDGLWEKATEAPTCRIKITESRDALKQKNESIRRDVAQYVQRIDETTDIGSVESKLSELFEKLKEDPYTGLKQQVESLGVNLKVFKRLKPRCLKKTVVKALEQLIFLKSLEMPFSLEELAGYAEELTRTQAKIALDELIEKNCGLRVEYVFDMDLIKKGRVKN